MITFNLSNCCKQAFLLKNILTYICKKPSVISIILICLTITEVHLNLVRHKHQSVITWDVVGYYSYLPATFIDKDLKLSSITQQNYKEYAGTAYSYVDDKNGNHVIKYSMGMALLYAPFFLTAHVLAQPLGYPPTGYSGIYQLFIEYSGLFYLLFGLLYLRKLLLLYYSENITALCIFVIFFGTNLLYYSTVDPAMSHSYTFSAFSVFLYYTVQYYKKPNLKYVLFLAVLFGLIILIRPLNILFALCLVCIGITSKEDIKKRITFFISRYKHILLFSILTAVAVVPQLLYWKYVTDHYLVFSYGKEGFYFTEPHLINCLIGFRKGWLIYSPVFIFAIAGFYFIKKQPAKVFYNLQLVLLPLYFYLVASWWCWWYGGSFGLRPMIDVYPLLTLPLAACFYKISELTKKQRVSLFGLVFFLVVLNMYQTFQYKYTIIHYDSMTAKAYVNVLGKMSRADIDTTLLSHPDYEKAVLGLGD